MRWKILFCAAIMFGLPGASVDAQAQTFPNRSIEVPGGFTLLVPTIAFITNSLTDSNWSGLPATGPSFRYV